MVDGVETPVEKIPPHDYRVSEIYLVPTIREERIKAIGWIFEWFATEAIGPRLITDRLNERKISAVHSPCWYPVRISKILRHPIYEGFASYYKTSQANFIAYGGKDESGSRKMVRVADSERVHRTRPREEWLMSDMPVWEPLADVDHVAVVKAKLADAKRRQAPRSIEAWLAGILVCDRCGKEMWGRDFTRKTKHGVTPYRWGYRCGTYYTFKDKNPYGCKGHSCYHDEIEDILLGWLDREGPGITALLAQAGDPEALKVMARDSERCHAILASMIAGMPRHHRGCGEAQGDPQWDGIRPRRLG